MSRGLSTQRFTINEDTEFKPVSETVHNSHLRVYFSGDCSMSFGFNNGDPENAVSVDETAQNKDFHIDFESGLLGNFTVHTNGQLDVEMIVSGEGFEIVTL